MSIFIPIPKEGARVDRDGLIESLGLKSSEGLPEEFTKIHCVHINEDDFILARRALFFLREPFSRSNQVYPRGDTSGISNSARNNMAE
jgi:hypothetical protein